jgi:hypothetical protein
VLFSSLKPGANCPCHPPDGGRAPDFPIELYPTDLAGGGKTPAITRPGRHSANAKEAQQSGSLSSAEWDALENYFAKLMENL